MVHRRRRCKGRPARPVGIPDSGPTHGRRSRRRSARKKGRFLNPWLGRYSVIGCPAEPRKLVAGPSRLPGQRRFGLEQHRLMIFAVQAQHVPSATIRPYQGGMVAGLVAEQKNEARSPCAASKSSTASVTPGIGPSSNSGVRAGPGGQGQVAAQRRRNALGSGRAADTTGHSPAAQPRRPTQAPGPRAGGVSPPAQGEQPASSAACQADLVPDAA